MEFTNVQEVFDKMESLFNPLSAMGAQVIFQFDITGEEGGKWNATIQDGTCKVAAGEHDDPSVTLIMSGETWLDMVNKKVNGMQALMAGKLKTRGSILKAKKLGQFFKI